MCYFWPSIPPTATTSMRGRNQARRRTGALRKLPAHLALTTSARVDHFLSPTAGTCGAESGQTYRRRSRARVSAGGPSKISIHKPSENYFLMVAEMVAYKRLDYAVRTFARNGRKLKLVGEGPEYKAL